MESLARPIRELADDLSWFVRARELRPLHIRTSAAQLRAGGLSPEVVAEDLPEQYIVVARRAAGSADR